MSSRRFSIDRSTLLAGITGIVVGLALFSAFNPDVNIGKILLADIAPGKINVAYEGQIGAKVTDRAIYYYSNINLETDELVITISKDPRVELLASDKKVEVNLLSPTMNQYIIKKPNLKKGELILKVEHNAKSTSDVTPGDVQSLSEGQFINLTVSNLTE